MPSPLTSRAVVARTERATALLRLVVVTAVAIVYAGSLGIRRTSGPLALSILVVAALYSLWTLLARPYEATARLTYAAGTMLLDAGLVALWIHATGGPKSEFWSLYLTIAISAAMRFDFLEVVGISFGLSALYVAITSVDGGLHMPQLLLRPALILVPGFGVGLLARQRRQASEGREALEVLAEERGTALADEQALVAKLRQVDMAKTELVAIASHEFRTPLAAILGVISTLRTHGDSLDWATKEELLEGAARQAGRLARLVEDLLTVSRIEEGALPMQLQAVHPQRIAFEAAQASGTGPQLLVQLNGVSRVHCDPDRVVRVLANLLENARKYSPPGAKIMLVMSEDAEWVRFAVRDYGPGVPEGERERVFDRFQRLSGSDAPGSGLGLYIAKCLVDAHGGTISVGDSPTGGAEFEFTLPRITTKAPGLLATAASAAVR